MNILIVGATGDIGSALARALKGQGQLWLTGRREDALFALADEIGAEAQPIDLADEGALSQFLGVVGALDRLFYSAGAVRPQPIRSTDRADWEATFVANLLGAFYVLKHARWNREARAVFLGAYPQRIAFPRLGAYTASKWGLEGLLSVARKELREVAITLVRLPAVATRLWTPFGGAPKDALSADEAAQRILQGIAPTPPPEVLEI